MYTHPNQKHLFLLSHKVDDAGNDEHRAGHDALLAHKDPQDFGEHGRCPYHPVRVACCAKMEGHFSRSDCNQRRRLFCYIQMATTVLLAVNGTSDVFCWLDAALKDKPKKVAAAQSENDSTWLAPVAKVPSKHPRVLNLVPSLKGTMVNCFVY